MELRDVRLSNERAFSLFERHSDAIYTLSQRPRVRQQQYIALKERICPEVEGK